MVDGDGDDDDREHGSLACAACGRGDLADDAVDDDDDDADDDWHE